MKNPHVLYAKNFGSSARRKTIARRALSTTKRLECCAACTTAARSIRWSLVALTQLAGNAYINAGNPGKGTEMAQFNVDAHLSNGKRLDWIALPEGNETPDDVLIEVRQAAMKNSATSSGSTAGTTLLPATATSPCECMRDARSRPDDNHSRMRPVQRDRSRDRDVRRIPLRGLLRGAQEQVRSEASCPECGRLGVTATGICYACENT